MSLLINTPRETITVSNSVKKTQNKTKETFAVRREFPLIQWNSKEIELRP